MAMLRALGVKAMVPVFIVSLLGFGVASNLFQVFLTFTLSPVSRVAFHQVTHNLNCAVGRMFIFFLEWAGGCRMRVFSDVPLAELQKEHSAIAMYNHVNSLDWLVVAWLMDRFGRLKSLRSLAKQSLAWIPVVGWTWHFCDFIFLKRNIAKDASTIRAGLTNIRRAAEGDSFGRWPFWVTIFPEGTRVTPAKLAESKKWQEKEGITPLKNLMYPRTKGFHHVWKGLGDHVDAVYDITLGYPEKTPELPELLYGPGCNVSILIRRLDLAAVEKAADDGADAVKQLVIAEFRRKDELLNEFRANGDAFSAPELFAGEGPLRSTLAWPLGVVALTHVVMFGGLAWGAPQALPSVGACYGAAMLASIVFF